jgi:hypothetical protein
MDASSASHWTGLRPDKSIRGSGQSSASPHGFESGDSNLSKLTDVFAAMQLTGTQRESQTGYANPPSNQTKHFRGSEWVLLELTTLSNKSFVSPWSSPDALPGLTISTHIFASALATCSGVAPRICIPLPQRWQHTRGLRLELAFLRPCVGNTLGGCALQPDASNAWGLRLHANLSIHSFCTRC